MKIECFSGYSSSTSIGLHGEVNIFMKYHLHLCTMFSLEIISLPKLKNYGKSAALIIRILITFINNLVVISQEF